MAASRTIAVLFLTAAYLMMSMRQNEGGLSNCSSFVTGHRFVTRASQQCDGTTTMKGRVNDEDTTQLSSETKMLRQSLSTLVAEIRQLREHLQGPSLATPATPPIAQTKAASSPLIKDPHPQTQKAQPTQQSQQPQQPQQVPIANSQKPPAGKTLVKVVSAGGDAGDIADFFLDDVKVPITGLSNRRGINVVVIDPRLGQVLSAKSYDIWGQAIEENKRLAADLKALPEDQIVLVALKDSGMENLDSNSLSALRRVGSTLENRLAFREGYVLIGSKEGEALAEKQGQKLMMVEVTLPFAVRSPRAPVRAR